MPAEQAVALFKSIYAVTLGIDTVSGILIGIGFLALALALSTRDGYNKIAALLAAVAAVAWIVLTIVSGWNYSRIVPNAVLVAWFFILGVKLIKSE